MRALLHAFAKEHRQNRKKIRQMPLTTKTEDGLYPVLQPIPEIKGPCPVSRLREGDWCRPARTSIDEAIRKGKFRKVVRIIRSRDGTLTVYLKAPRARRAEKCPPDTKVRAYTLKTAP